VGEGLSGLARAFFFAGARALLVSHWSVNDAATQSLMTNVFEQRKENWPLLPAEDLQRGMLTMLEQAEFQPEEKGYLAHPFAWASFFVVGAS
jgi:CHAT domain-containing protein